MSTSANQERLASIGQSGVLRFYDSLDEAGKAKLDAQLAALDINTLPGLVDGYVKNKPKVDLPTDIKPVNAYPHSSDNDEYAKAKARGLELLKQGKVAAFLVAGGQGTRLGYEGPKGEYPVTPIKKKPLFQVFAEQLTAASKTAGKAIPWYIMTSDTNDAATRAFFEKHQYFGLDKSLIKFFPQGMMPAFDKGGDLLLASKDSLALSADGHGGSFRALRNSGALDDMKKRGIEHLSYFQVDNPIVKVIDPLFIGLHDLTGSEMSSKTINKAGPLEKVGNFCIGDGKTQVIEYSDLPESLAMQTNADGTRTFDAGSIAIHALRVSFIDRLTAPGSDLNLIWHRADKKVPFVNDAGELVKPTEPNAVKLEQFVFDAIPLASNPLIYTTKREDEFSPVKNADGNDSPATCTRDQIRLFARWLEAAGVSVPRKADGEPDATIEISPLFATSAEELKTKPLQVKKIEAGQSVYFG
ncbi:MAG: UTP--glucose-phosphate uridylyltransferase [Phycisphaerales bacterium]|nr:UTP--glucose-phosphate uridylyltransferase [Phycisphaerales bacterium]